MYNMEHMLSAVYSSSDQKTLWAREGFEVITEDEEGRPHSFSDEPAITKQNETSLTQIWMKNGQAHRGNDLPAIVKGIKGSHYICGYQHRVKGMTYIEGFSDNFYGHMLYGKPVTRGWYEKVIQTSDEQSIPIGLSFLLSLSHPYGAPDRVNELADIPAKYWAHLLNVSAEKHHIDINVFCQIAEHEQLMSMGGLR